jgi:hypothetical protein
MIVPQLRQFWITRFDFLGGLLPGNVAPSDIDQVLERRGHFLFIECKRPYQPSVRGQEILFDHLLEPMRSVYLLRVVGHPPDKLESWQWWGKDTQLHQSPNATDEVRTLVRDWWNWAGTA